MDSKPLKGKKEVLDFGRECMEAAKPLMELLSKSISDDYKVELTASEIMIFKRDTLILKGLSKRFIKEGPKSNNKPIIRNNGTNKRAKTS